MRPRSTVHEIYTESYVNFLERGASLNTNILRIAAAIIALLVLALATIMLIEHFLTGLWLLPMIFILLLLAWSPWNNSRKRKSQ